MMAAMTLLLDSLQLPYTGNSTEALVATASKLSVKQRLARVRSSDAVLDRSIPVQDSATRLDRCHQI